MTLGLFPVVHNKLLHVVISHTTESRRLSWDKRTIDVKNVFCVILKLKKRVLIRFLNFDFNVFASMEHTTMLPNSLSPLSSSCSWR